MNYYLSELHSHTKHSDGDFTTEDLVTESIKYGYEVLVITDHNTMAPVMEIENIDTKNLLVIPGMEWTTFFGHLLVIGATRVIDWRTATIDTIDASLKEVKAAKGITGIAHPFSIGSPICTGCHWDFHIEDYGLINFIEVWNRLNPESNMRSNQAYDMWVDLLNQGNRVSCSAGRDWHRLEKDSDSTALTYIGAIEKKEANILESLENGNFYITLGPKIDIYLEKDGVKFYMGDEVVEGSYILRVIVSPTEQEKLKTFNFLPKKIIGLSCDGIEFEQEIALGTLISIPVDVSKGYFRVEALGCVKGVQDERLIICNPFYVR